MTEPPIVVAVVAFGHASQLPTTLRSILAQNYPSQRLQIVVVDNGDGSSAAVARTAAPEAFVIEPGSNLGFAGGCNLAVEQSAADVIALINPDVELLQPDFLRVLTQDLRNPDIGVVGGKLIFPASAGGTVQHAGGVLKLPLALTSHRGHGDPDAPEYNNPVDVPYVTGAAFATRRETWNRLGGMDETFWPAYFEEVDFCMRVSNLGLRVRYIPGAIATHQEAATLGRASVGYYRLYHANRLRLLFKHRDVRWLASEWLPAELEHLRTTADDNEVDGLLWSYHTWQAHFTAGSAAPTARLDRWRDPPAPQGPPEGSELAWTLDQAAQKRTIAPRPFTSRLPGLARLRQSLNHLATEEYLRPIIQQQNDFNATLVELAGALERQRRTADGAVLCQGMFVARLIAQKQA